ncbi:MAG: hypothetical protein ACR2KZ_08115, partial [Segetibacter sp.]
DEKGMVISSTNKKLEGKSYASVGNPGYLSDDSTVFNKVDDNTLEISSPVMGFNKKMVRLFLIRRRQKPT